MVYTKLSPLHLDMILAKYLQYPTVSSEEDLKEFIKIYLVSHIRPRPSGPWGLDPWFKQN